MTSTVCGLTPDLNGNLSALFWRWQWDRAPEPLDVTPIANELRSARAAVFDGPRALAKHRQHDLPRTGFFARMIEHGFAFDRPLLRRPSSQP